jgi:kynureninase
MYIHEKHASDPDFPRLSGWWGHDARERFQMKNELNPIPSVDGWQLSNVNILPAAAHLASLSVFEEVQFKDLRAKSLKMTAWLIEAIESMDDEVEIITPKKPEARGCQLSLCLKTGEGRKVFDSLTEAGVVCDWREPNVIRIAPTPLYNTFEEVGRFFEIFSHAITKS